MVLFNRVFHSRIFFVNTDKSNLSVFYLVLCSFFSQGVTLMITDLIRPPSLLILKWIFVTGLSQKTVACLQHCMLSGCHRALCSVPKLLWLCDLPGKLGRASPMGFSFSLWHTKSCTQLMYTLKMSIHLWNSSQCLPYCSLPPKISSSHFLINLFDYLISI